MANSTCNGSKRVTNNSLDQETGTCTANTKKCSNENLRLEIQPSVIEINDSDEEQMNRRRNNEFINDTNRTQIKAFSLEEDTELILFFKSRELYLNDIHYKCVYKVFQKRTSTTRSCDELQDRLVNHILPNLFTYKCLTYDEMIKYYDCAGMEVPEQLQLRISELLREHARMKQAVLTHNQSTGTDKITVDVATQVTEPAHENGQLKIYHAGKYVGIRINNVQHIFVSDTDQDHCEDRKEIHDKFIIADENIHFVDATLHTMLNSAGILEDILKSCIDEYLEKAECNLTNMLPVLDKMELLASGIDIDETVCSVESEVEIISKHLSEIDCNSKHNVDDSMNNNQNNIS